jgi:hypothetical protein
MVTELAVPPPNQLLSLGVEGADHMSIPAATLWATDLYGAASRHYVPAQRRCLARPGGWRQHL